jgi:hypothetical protein
MTITVRTVNFGVGKTGIATIGYRLLNADGTEYAARTTAGIVETLAGTGIYQAEISIPDSWQGIILWDTGETPTPKYAADSVNVAPSGGTSTFYTGAVDTDAKGTEQLKKDIKTLIAQNKRILAKIDDVNQTVVTQNTQAQKITEAIQAMDQKQGWQMVENLLLDLRQMSLKESERSEDMKLRVEFLKGLLKESIALNESGKLKDATGMDALIEAFALFVEYFETKDTLQEVADHVESSLAKTEDK